MRRLLSPAEAAALPADVLLRVEGISRALPPPPKAPPGWLVRILPKSGLAGQPSGAGDDVYMDDEDDEELEDEFLEEERAALHPLSFDVRAGEGLGLVGEDRNAITTLMRILIGGVPPSTGRVVFRGLVAPISIAELQRLMVSTFDRKSADVAARYFKWPLAKIDERWAEIEEFAALEEIETMAKLPPIKRARRRGQRLAISAALHMDATVYVVDHTILDDREFAARVLDVVAQRKAEGAAVIQSARRGVDEVARLADEVMWIVDGQVASQGTPLQVAQYVARTATEQVESHVEPVTARLEGTGPLELPTAGGRATFAIEVLRKNLELAFTLELVDAIGNRIEARKHDRLEAPDPGVYRLKVPIPQGLEEGAYSGRLTVEIAVAGHEAAAPRELLAFDAVLQDIAEADAAELGPEGFLFMPVLDEEIEAEFEDEAHDVSRTRA